MVNFKEHARGLKLSSMLLYGFCFILAFIIVNSESQSNSTSNVPGNSFSTEETLRSVENDSDLGDTCKRKLPKCLETGGSCVSMHDETIICVCPVKTEYESGIGCKVLHDACNTNFPNCLETGGSCVSKRAGTIICECPEKTEYESGIGCKENLCKSICGDLEGIKCEDDEYDENTVKCICENANADFLNKEQGCKENFCISKCGGSAGVLCDGDHYDEKNLKCTCASRYADFLDRQKGCLENYCKYYCEPNDVKCVGDPYDVKVAKCICDNEEEYFDYNKRKCVVDRNTCHSHWPKCFETGGFCISTAEKTVKCICPRESQFVNGSGCKEDSCTYKCGELTDVVCEVNPYNRKEVKCTCKNKNADFIDDIIGCKENFCKSKCGELAGVVCKGDPYDDKKVQCICESTNEGFIDKDHGCKGNLCDDHPCLNGGKCLDFGLSFQCICEDGFEGERCENRKKNPCTDTPCLNGGTCFVFHDKFKCACHDAFAGGRCEIDITDPCRSKPCLNGGMCFAFNNTFKCACVDTFAGETCGIDISGCTLKMNMSIWILCSVIALLILIISCVAFCRCKNRTREKTVC